MSQACGLVMARWRSAFLRVVGLPIALLVVPGCLATAEARTSRQDRPVTLHPGHFRVVATEIADIASNGRYVFLRSLVAYGESGTLLDTRTGVRRTLSRPGCGVDMPVGWSVQPFGGPWLMFNCMGNPLLYRLSDRSWKALPPAFPDICELPAGDSCGPPPIAVGTDWIEYSGQSCYHCSPSWYFQNIRTGAVRTLQSWRPGGKTYPNLDTPRLGARLCPPLRVPLLADNVGGGGFDPEPGWIGFYGRTALMLGETASGRQEEYLERCGSRARERVENIPDAAYVTANQHELGWLQGGLEGDDELAGVFLPSLRRFVLPLTPGRFCEAVLGVRDLYLTPCGYDPQGLVLAAPMLRPAHADGRRPLVLPRGLRPPRSRRG
jgi:hypothetical protein